MSTSVYKYYAGNGSPLYVGVTSSGQKRQRQHVADAAWWHLVARCEIEHHPTREAALLREKILIRELCPTFNVVHSTRTDKLAVVQQEMKERQCEGREVIVDTLEERAKISAAMSELGKRRCRSGEIAMPTEITEYFAKMGRRGGRISRDSLTPEQRQAAARKAVNARWAKNKTEK